jgi:phage tail sheath protein FI
MAELLTPGVFIQEIDFGPQPIEGVSTSTAGFVGETEKGPVSGPPLLVTSFPDFQRQFGRFNGKALPLAVRGFFDNGGKRAFIMRVVDTTAGTGALNASSGTTDFQNAGYNVAILAISGRQVTLSSVVGLGIGNTLHVFSKATGTEVTGSPFAVDSVNGATGVVTLATTVTLDPSITPATHFSRIVDGAVTPGAVIGVTARDPGSFGNSVSVLVDAQYANNTPILAANATKTDFVLGAVDFIEVGAAVQFENATGTARELAKIISINAATKTIKVAALTGDYGPDSAVPRGPGKLYLVSWRIAVGFQGATVETLGSLSAALDGSNHATELLDSVNNRSQWIRIKANPTLNPLNGAFPTFAFAQPALLAGGQDGGTPGSTDVIGDGTVPRTGLKSIEATQGVNIIAAPGFTAQDVVNELISQAERLQDRFAVFEASQDVSVTNPSVTAVLAERARYNSRYAAMYYPWVLVTDPLTKQQVAVPPSGHVIGAYARTDNERGVFKAPANVVLRNILGFSVEVPDGEQDLLNPNGVDVVRRFDGLGNVIWGGRTISAESLWRYVSVRRLFIFIEQSIVKGTRFAVFEPNDQRLWAKLRDAVTNFLTTQWRAGALFGAKPEQAFFVKVDETTTTQDDRDNGRVNIVVGIAPVRPAEFVVFQIGQAPNSVIIAEQS